MNLHLVRKGLTQAVMFSPEGKVEFDLQKGGARRTGQFSTRYKSQHRHA